MNQHPTALESIAYGLVTSIITLGIMLLAFYQYAGG